MTIAAGSVMLVTGATGAIGGEIAAQAAAAGAVVVAVHGSGETSVLAAIARLRARVPGARMISAPADFRAPDAIAAMVARVAGEAGRIDAIVHCGIAGAAGVTGPFASADADALAAHAALVLGSFQRLCHAALTHLAVRGGTIVGFASDAGRFAAPRQSVVGAALGGIMAFVRNLALETAREGVRVHYVAPGFVAGTPACAAHAARAGKAADRAGLGLPTPADIAPLVLFLCGAGAMRITGQVISVNGGLHA